jgi:hypothetical protein
MPMANHDLTSQSPPQLRYALLVEWGTRIGLLVLAFSFIAYAGGLVPAHVPLERLPHLWSQPLSDYVAATGSPTGWAWLQLLHRSDVMGLAGIAILSVSSVVGLLALVPLYVALRDRTFVVLCLLQALVVLLAASGLLSGGH